MLMKLIELEWSLTPFICTHFRFVYVKDWYCTLKFFILVISNARDLSYLQSQQVEINFVRQGGHVNAIGAFVEGVEQKMGKWQINFIVAIKDNLWNAAQGG